MEGRIGKSARFASLPAVWPEELRPRIRRAVAARQRKVVVLDDDPTGTQTVYDVPVLTTWDVDALSAEFAQPASCFYLLTNSRAYVAAEAVRLNREIGRNLALAARQHPGRHEFVVVSRSDSTLRGHFPAEVNALAGALQAATPGSSGSTPQHLPPVLLVPYFEAGGRYTVGDIHYVAEGDDLVPAAETPFAQDAAFGYRHSDLRAWVEEKTTGRIAASEVRSISLDDLRRGGPEVVCRKLLALPEGSVCIANSACERDLEVLAWAALQAEEAGSRILYRTAASFVAARLGLEPRPLWQPPITGSTAGGLAIVGSYVPKTTAQLAPLLAEPRFAGHEISVEQVLKEGAGAVVPRTIEQIERALGAGRDVVVYTSRKLVRGENAAACLAVGNQVSQGLVEIVQRLKTPPRYLLAKGGITSSELATRGLGVKRAMVLGQILPGVPVWELGPETRFPGLPYVVFPGNVGGPDALKAALASFQSRSI